MKKNIFLIVILALTTSYVTAQTVTHGATKADPTDIQGWYGTSFNTNLPRKWSANLNYQARFIDNMGYYNGSYLTLGAAKKLNKHLEFMGDYRLALVRAGVYHRFTFGAELSKKIKHLNLAFRFQLQNQLQEFDDVTKPTDKSGYWRTRFQGKYAFNKKWEAYASIEPIMKFGATTYFVDNIRNTIGCKYKIKKDLKLDVFYIYRPDYAKSYNRLYHIIGLNADYSFKVKKHKKKSS
jgi:hypothetical protein